jgi:hypothetical protein
LAEAPLFVADDAVVGFVRSLLQAEKNGTS